jgi:phage gp36-like protein
MTYSTTSALLSRFDAEEMAQRTDRSVPRQVTGDMLATLAAGGSMAAYTAPQQAAAAAALAVLQTAQQDAYDTINGYIQGRYDIPLATPPNAILLAESDLARYFLYDDNTTEVIKRRYDAALDYLKSIRDGKINLGPVGGAPAPSPVGTPQVVTGTPTFNDDTLALY